MTGKVKGVRRACSGRSGADADKLSTPSHEGIAGCRFRRTLCLIRHPF